MAVPSLEQRKKAWDNIAQTYAKTVEESHLTAGITLSRMTRIQSAQSILEVGCATGLLPQYWANHLPSGTKYIATDLSDEMVKMAQNRIDSLKFKPDAEFVFRSADAENLDFVADESIDVYMSCLCLNVMPNPAKALQEALRVVKKGGRIGISINTTSERNFFNKVIRSRGDELGVEDLKNVNKGWLGDKEALLKVCQEAGIQVELCWEQEAVYSIFDDGIILGLAKQPAVTKIFDGLTEDIKDKFLGGMKNHFEEERSKMIPVTSVFSFIVGTKPE